jgi:hypothetical protein
MVTKLCKNQSIAVGIKKQKLILQTRAETSKTSMGQFCQFTTSLVPLKKNSASSPKAVNRINNLLLTILPPRRGFMASLIPEKKKYNKVIKLEPLPSEGWVPVRERKPKAGRKPDPLRKQDGLEIPSIKKRIITGYPIKSHYYFKPINKRFNRRHLKTYIAKRLAICREYNYRIRKTLLIRNVYTDSIHSLNYANMDQFNKGLLMFLAIHT